MFCTLFNTVFKDLNKTVVSDYVLKYVQFCIINLSNAKDLIFVTR